MIECKGGKVFLSSADAMAMVSQKRLGTLPGLLHKEQLMAVEAQPSEELTLEALTI